MSELKPKNKFELEGTAATSWPVQSSLPWRLDIGWWTDVSGQDITPITYVSRDVTVNNVGMTCIDHFAYFLETPDAEQKITQIINCNILSVPQMTRLVLPGMVDRGTGLIINISSEVGLRPHPLLALYSATKIFVTYFSQCLHAEYKSVGITVQCVAPLMVSTNMTHNMQVNCLVKSASRFAYEAVNTVGHSSYTSGCLSHALQSAALSLLLPDWLRMSTFFIRVLRNLPDRKSCQRGASQEKEWLTGKKE